MALKSKYLDGIVKLFKEKGLEIFILLLFALTVIALFAGAGVILLKMLLSAAFGFIALLLTGNKLSDALRKFGIEKYWRTIVVVCFIIIGLWNWLLLILLLAFLLTWNLL